MPVATLTVGWPDEHPEQTDRLPLEAVVHEETYCDYTPETIDRYYGPKEQLPENRHFCGNQPQGDVGSNLHGYPLHP